MYKYKLSVITINYNNGEGLKRTIESVVNQTNKDFEFIIIDGGSTDGSVEIIKEYVDEIDYWVSEKDRGIYHAMNKGVAVANGEYCIFMNSGDMFYDNEVIKKVYDNELSADIVTGIMSWEVNQLAEMRYPPLSVSFLTFYWDNELDHQASFIRTSLLVAVPYDESLKIVSDWKFFMQTLIEQNSSYAAILVIVARSDTYGVSSDKALSRQERQQVLLSMFPHRILVDYENLDKKTFILKKWILDCFCKYKLINKLYGIYVHYKMKKYLKNFNEKSKRICVFKNQY